MTRISQRFTPRQTLVTTLTAAALLGGYGLAQAQSTTQTPAPNAAKTNEQNTQGLGADSSTAARPDGTRMDTTPSPSTGTMSQRSGTSGDRTSAATSTQTTPSASDTNRDASQGMAAERDSTRTGAMSSGSTTMDDSMGRRNDRTTMARAPRADRN